MNKIKKNYTFSVFFDFKYNKAFTLIEVLLVVGIIAIISVAGSSFYNNYNKSIEIKTTAKIISTDLRQMQSKSMNGENGLKWGIHFVNSDQNYYELFSTTDSYEVGKTIITTNYLPNGISFYEPGTSSSKDIIFNKIVGNTNPSTVSIVSNGVTQNIEIAGIGTVSYGSSYSNIAIPTSYNITSILGANGSILPSGVVSVASGENKSFIITPDSGYSVSTLTIDGSHYTPDTYFLFNNVSSPHTISVTFDLSIITPTVTSPTHTLVVDTTATLGANVTSLGVPALISARGTCYGTSPAPTTNCVAASGTTTGVFTQARTGLTAETLYYYRGYATNTTGTAYSADGTFTTSAPACEGISSNGYCWYPAAQGTTCNTTCTNHGGCVNATLTYTKESQICALFWSASVGGLSGSIAPRYDGSGWCYVQGNISTPDSPVTENSCSQSSQWHYNACSCSN